MNSALAALATLVLLQAGGQSADERPYYRMAWLEYAFVEVEPEESPVKFLFGPRLVADHGDLEVRVDEWSEGVPKLASALRPSFTRRQRVRSTTEGERVFAKASAHPAQVVLRERTKGTELADLLIHLASGDLRLTQVMVKDGSPDEGRAVGLQQVLRTEASTEQHFSPSGPSQHYELHVVANPEGGVRYKVSYKVLDDFAAFEAYLLRIGDALHEHPVYVFLDAKHGALEYLRILRLLRELGLKSFSVEVVLDAEQSRRIESGYGDDWAWPARAYRR